MKFKSSYTNPHNVVFLNTVGGMTFRHPYHGVDLPYYDIKAAMAQMEMWAKKTEEEDIYPILLFEGGADIHPKIYGQVNTHSHVGDDLSTRDIREMVLYHKGKELNLPMFGICRGHQMLAALNGGTLHQDIGVLTKSYHGGDIIAMGDLLPFRGEIWSVNHLHHQAVDRVPSNASVVAVAEVDNLNEALYYKHDRMFSVQWHPELQSDFELVEYVVDLFKNTKDA